jgi:hypothetical protein
MTVYGKPGKRWYRFPPFPQTLEIDEADSHIPTATTTTRTNLILKTRPVKRYAFEGKVMMPIRALKTLWTWGELSSAMARKEN